jgi:hypothetical protein
LVVGRGLDNGSRTYLEALTSAIKNGIDRLAVGVAWERAYLMRPTLPLVAMELRLKCRTVG